MNKKIRSLVFMAVCILSFHKALAQEVNLEGELLPKTNSGPTEHVPWENDENFKAVQKETGAGILLAAYETILKDPLPGEEYNVHHGARKLSGTVIKPGQVFSLNSRIGPYTYDKGYKNGPSYAGARITATVGGGVCKISSTLYNIAALSNLGVLERFSHSMPVPYVPYGQDATVVHGVKDLKIKNTTAFPILIWAQGIDNTLYMAVYGNSYPPKVEWQNEVLRVIKAPELYRTSTQLAKGEKKMVMEGMNGGIVRSKLIIQEGDGTFTVKNMGKSYYDPIPYVYEKGR